MEIKDYTTILPKNIKPATFNCLIPDSRNYSTLLLQPKGELEATEAFVRNRDRATAHTDFYFFLQLAYSQNADLAVTPEYSCPWSTIETSLKEDVFPEAGQLWILGCESISKLELEELRKRQSHNTKMLYDLPKGTGSQSFLDPVCFLFTSQYEKSGKPVRIIIVQFKTTPMGDNEHHFERDNLITGKSIYHFHNRDTEAGPETVNLYTLVCSDALGLNQEPKLKSTILHQSLVVHIQLNKDPRHDSFSRYRENCFSDRRGENTEIICLNWAQNVRIHLTTTVLNWNNIGGSALYTKSAELQVDSTHIENNHKLGLYLTYWQPGRTYALYFNYEPYIFFFQTTKVMQTRSSPTQQGRTGPKMLNLFSKLGEQWESQSVASGGMEQYIHPMPKDVQSILNNATTCNLDMERLICFSTGLADSTDWHEISKIQSVIVFQNQVVNRFTFAQDQDRNAHIFRTTYFGRIKGLIKILSEKANYPIQIADLFGRHSFLFSMDNPTINLHSTSSGVAGGAAVYIGEESYASLLAQKADKLRRAFGESTRYAIYVSTFPGQPLRIITNENKDINGFFLDPGDIRRID